MSVASASARTSAGALLERARVGRVQARPARLERRRAVRTQPSAVAAPVEDDDVPERGELGAARRELRDLLVVLDERDHRAGVGRG